MKIRTIILFLSIMLTAFFAACSNWTEQESLEIEYPSIEDENPLEYQEYLSNLRIYKKTYHPLMIGIFDNSDKTFRSRAARIKAIPDKVDIVSLMYGDNLEIMEQQDMVSVRNEKGTRIMYNIAFEELKKYVEDTNFDIENDNLAGTGDPSYVPKPLLDITEEVTKYMDTQLALLDKYGYDGFILHYDGKATHFMKDQEIEEMRKMQDLIFGKSLAIISAHPDKTFILEGRPQNVLDKRTLLSFNYFLVRTQFLKTIREVTSSARELLEYTEVPSNNILVGACANYVDGDANSWGEIYGEDGSKQNAIVEIAYWTKIPDAFTKVGMAVYMFNRDYFNPDLDYKHVREAINIMNPSPIK